MDAQQDTKPFLPAINAAAIHRALYGPPSTRLQPPPPPPERGGARGLEAPAACVVNRAASDLSGGSGGGGGGRSCPEEAAHESTSARRPCPCPAPRITRNFWSAGDYEAPAGSSAREPQNVQNRMCVHPKFLHSNATSHKWPFGAVAELLDNAVDERENGGATRIQMDKVIDKRNGLPALLIQDDGGGMDPDLMRRCMSFGFSDKQSGSSIGQYGNGFKTSTMRLGSDVIVFSRSTKSGEPTQSIGLLSYTFLVETGHKDVVVPVVDYKCNLFTGQTKRFERLGPDQFSSNLSVLLKWSPFVTEEDLMQNFSDIGPHGTKIIVFNLWANDAGDLELDFDTDPEDIMISGAPNPAQITNSVRRINESHLANRLRYSLRIYASVLYLHLPEYFKIILRGQEVKRHKIAADLIYPECISYKPQVCGRKEAEVFTSIGFLSGSPTVSVHGFNIYHRNRLILPFHRVLSSASSKGRGVAGVLEANFIKPTHDKQDFEKSQLYQKLINRLKDMTTEYWDIHCKDVGYSKTPRRRVASVPLAPPAMLPIANTASEPSGGSAPAPAIAVTPLRSRGPCEDAVPISFAPPVFSTPPGTSTAAPRAPAGYSPSDMQMMQVDGSCSSAGAPGTDLADTRKRRNDDDDDDSGLMVPSKRQVTQDLAGSSLLDSSDQVCQYMGEQELREFSFLKLENTMLRDECMQFEMSARELLLKERNMRLEIERAQAEYKNLLNEYVSVSAVPATKQNPKYTGSCTTKQNP
ncbi:hypothetical protein ACP4OV_019850 [Aristida adscensionis]